MPDRIQRQRTKGWRMPENTVSVVRPGLWGNPFYVSRWRDAATCVALFRESVRGCWDPNVGRHLPDAWCGYAEHNGWLALWRHRMNGFPIEFISELRGKNLACWCAVTDRHGNAVPCHADVLLSLANNIPLEDVIRENLRRTKGKAL